MPASDDLERERFRLDGPTPRRLEFAPWEDSGGRWLALLGIAAIAAFMLWIAAASLIPLAAARWGQEAPARVAEVRRSAGRTTTYSCRLVYRDAQAREHRAFVSIPFPTFESLKPGAEVRVRALAVLPFYASLDGNEVFELQGAAGTGPFFLLVVLFCLVAGPGAAMRQYRLLKWGRPVIAKLQPGTRGRKGGPDVAYEWAGRRIVKHVPGAELGPSSTPGVDALMLVDPRNPERAMFALAKGLFRVRASPARPQ